MGAGWKCSRVSGGVTCGHRNTPRSRKCAKCAKPRPARRQKKHEGALKLSYEEYVKINGGVERCGICELPPRGRRLCRDHEHRSDGTPRGLLCPACNRALVANRYGTKMTPEWLRAAAAYLDRAKASAEERARLLARERVARERGWLTDEGWEWDRPQDPCD